MGAQERRRVGGRGWGRLALGLLGAAAGLWAAWWPVGAWLEVRSTEAWLAERRAAGWQAEMSDIEITGFPLRYQRRLVAPMLADPSGGWAWQAPDLVIDRARHARLTEAATTVTWPAQQTLRRPDRSAEITAGALRAELWRAGPQEILTRALLTGEEIGIALRLEGDTLLWQARSLDVLAVAAEEDAARIDLTARLRATEFADAEGERLPGPERVDLGAQIRFDRPWDEAALTERRPQPREIALREAALDWGGLALRVAGDLTIDADGVPSGRLVVQATNWRAWLDAARDRGQLPESVADAVAAAADLASRLSGRPDRLDLPLVFDGGRVRLGLLPLGTAPRIALP